MNPAQNTAPAAPALTIDTASQAGSLDELAGVAASMEGWSGAAAPGAPAGTAMTVGMPNPLELSNAQVLLDAITALRDGFCFFTKLKAPKAIAQDAALRDLAVGWGKWTAKRSYDLKTLMGEHADTIPLVISTCALAWAVYEGTKGELAARTPIEAKDKKAEPAAAPAAPAAAEGNNVAVFPGQGRTP